MREFFAQYWPSIISSISLLISLASLFLSYKVRRDGIILKLTPKFTASFERAKRTTSSYFKQMPLQDGYTVRCIIQIDNPTPYALELMRIGCRNYFLDCIGDFDTQNGYRVLVPEQHHAKEMLISAGKGKLYFFDAFIANEHLIPDDKFPDIEFTITLFQHSDPSKEQNFRVVRPVRPGIIITQ